MMCVSQALMKLKRIEIFQINLAWGFYWIWNFLPQIIEDSLDLLPELLDDAPDLTNPSNLRSFSDSVFDAVEPLIPEEGKSDFRINRRYNNAYLNRIIAILRRMPEIPSFEVPDSLDLDNIVISDTTSGFKPELSN